MEILQDIWLKIKPILVCFILGFLFGLSLVLAFSLSLIEGFNKHSFIIQEKSNLCLENNLKNVFFEEKYPYFASKNGTKYYPISCKAGERISKENRIYFKSEQEAQMRGFDMSKSCVK